MIKENPSFPNLCNYFILKPSENGWRSLSTTDTWEGDRLLDMIEKGEMPTSLGHYLFSIIGSEVTIESNRRLGIQDLANKLKSRGYEVKST